MSKELRPAIFARVERAARKFSGIERIQGDSRIYADLGLGGWDFIEFIEELERDYEISLEQLSPHGKGLAIDVTVNELVDTISRQLDAK